MTNLIIMLVLMTAPYLVARAVSASSGRAFDLPKAAAVGLALLFLFTGIGHFARTDAMAQMLPYWVPQRTLLVYLTGVLEFAIAAGFLLPKFRRLAGRAAAAVLVVFFPANSYAALNHVPMGGHAWGPVYLLVRAPVQLIILAWVYVFVLRQSNGQRARP